MRFLVLALILVASSALAQPGTLDATFGGDGRVMLDVGAGTGDGSGADRAIPLSDGDILVIGGVGEDAFAARLNQDGSLDPGFGSGGIARVDAGGFEERFTDAVVLESGAIVLSGARQSKDDDEGFVARLRTTTRDSSHGLRLPDS